MLGGGTSNAAGSSYTEFAFEYRATELGSDLICKGE